MIRTRHRHAGVLCCADCGTGQEQKESTPRWVRRVRTGICSVWQAFHREGRSNDSNPSTVTLRARCCADCGTGQKQKESTPKWVPVGISAQLNIRLLVAYERARRACAAYANPSTVTLRARCLCRLRHRSKTKREHPKVGALFLLVTRTGIEPMLQP